MRITASVNWKGLAALGPSTSSPADTIENKSANCLAAIVQLLTKKTAQVNLAVFFVSNLFFCRFIFSDYI